MRNQHLETCGRLQLTKALRLAMAVPILSACVTLAPPITHKTEAVAHVKAPEPKTWNAVLDFFSRPWFLVDSVDRAVGLIKISFAGTGGVANCYDTEVALRQAITSDWSQVFEPSPADRLGIRSDGRVPVVLTEYTIKVTGDSAKSTVHLTANWTGVSTKPLHCQLTHYWDGGFEDAIRGRAETRAPFWHKAQP